MVLCPEDVVSVESALYQELKKNMGKNWKASDPPLPPCPLPPATCGLR